MKRTKKGMDEREEREVGEEKTNRVDEGAIRKGRLHEMRGRRLHRLWTS